MSELYISRIQLMDTFVSDLILIAIIIMGAITCGNKHQMSM
jgi:hypothetical protein